MHKSFTTERSQIDNFSIKSKAMQKIMTQPKHKQIKTKQKKQEIGRNKIFLINGVDFHSSQMIINKQGEILQDCYSVKGDYFYLKKGDIVNIRYSIGAYVQIKFQKSIGYFPANLIRLIEGQIWNDNKSNLKKRF